jgi:hypothetical protein
MINHRWQTLPPKAPYNQLSDAANMPQRISIVILTATEFGEIVVWLNQFDIALCAILVLDFSATLV